LIFRSIYSFVPVAKKVILVKEEIKEENYINLYFSLNETEIIRAEENRYKFEISKSSNLNYFLKKYIEKIDGINSVFQDLSKENFYSSFYEQLAFKEFLAVNKVFQNLKNKYSYFLNNREIIFDALINTNIYENYKRLYIVMPTYNDNNIFEKSSPKTLKLQRRLIELSLKVKIEIVFVINDCKKELSLEFKNFLESAIRV